MPDLYRNLQAVFPGFCPAVIPDGSAVAEIGGKFAICRGVCELPQEK